MKNFILFLILFLIACKASAQCPDSSVTLSSDEDVAEFVRQYPNCTDLPGDLIISSKDGFASTRTTSLSGLEKITSIGGNLIVKNNLWLTSIRALSNVVRVGGDFIIEKNAKLEEGMIRPACARVDGDLKILGYKNSGNHPFDNLIKVGGSIYLAGFERMQNLFPNLWKIGGKLNISGNYNLQEINDFHNLTEIGDEFYIGYNVSLKDIRGFYYLKEVKKLRLQSLRLNRLELGPGFDSVESVSLEQVNFSNRLSCFGKIKHLKYLSLHNVPSDLILLFEELEEVDQMNLSIQGDLENPVYPFPKLKKVNESLTIANPASVAIIASIKTVGKNVEIYRLQDMRQLAPLSNIDSIGNRVQLTNGTFENFEGLPEIHADRLIFRNNFNLKNLKGLDLSKLDINELNISSNGIESLEGVYNEPAKKMKISISYNKKLTDCKSEYLCPLLKSDKIKWEIRSNGEGCELNEIKKECE